MKEIVGKMSLDSASRGASIEKIRGRYLGRHMDHLADSTAKLSQGRENWYIGMEGVPVDDSSWEKCEPVIVFECMDLSIGQGVNVSGLSCV